MSGQLAADAHISLAGLQVVDGADVVQATAGDVVPRGGVGAGHHPGGAQRDGMDLEERRRFNIRYRVATDGRERGGHVAESARSV